MPHDSARPIDPGAGFPAHARDAFSDAAHRFGNRHTLRDLLTDRTVNLDANAGIEAGP